MSAKSPSFREESYNPSKPGSEGVHIENTSANIFYDDDEHEPELRGRTYYALAAMFLLNLVQVLALQGPPTVVCSFVKFTCIHELRKGLTLPYSWTI